MAAVKGSTKARDWSRHVHERHHMAIVAALGADAGLWSWKSSPHALWLASQLNHVCWLPQ